MRIRSLALLCLGATIALGQQNTPEDPAGIGRYGPLTLASEFFDNNYFNYSLFANGVFDTYAPTLNTSGQQVNNGAFGYSVGGGLSAAHRFRRGSLSLNYSGSYQDYRSSFFSSGTNQNLNFGYNTRLGRRWILGVGVGAGILFYGNSYLGSQPNSGTYVQANPFGAETRFVSTSASIGYQFSRRLTVALSGSFFLQRYSFAGAIGTTGGSGDVSVSYRVTARTTVSSDYSHSYFKYQRGAGNANVDNVSFSAFHAFPGHWIVSGSGGVAHSNTSGLITIPISLITGQQGAGGYITGLYRSTANLPSFYGSVSHNQRRSSFFAGGGQSIVSGNGYFLASRNQFINGGYSRSFRRSNISGGFNYYRLKSVANSVESTYNGFTFGGGYSYLVTRHLSTNFRYDYLRYGSLAPLNSVADNRLSFGVSFSSKSIPLTFY